ncbi:hypothetical protein [Piscinibacter sp.]|uniref:hypothetical protein n=1 Tax=Piscinibacter sp. TaxID=1903157 RepID=UPI002D0435FC|nr:hypothetical protein [Albitalea sp.]HUG24771.1 hypothetical protein [Albitalea sp.]
MIARNATTQAQLISDLMDMNQVLTGTSELDLTRVDAAELVDRAIGAVAPQIAKKGLVVINSVERNLALEGDQNRLLQVFWISVTPSSDEGTRFEVRLPRSTS